MKTFFSGLLIGAVAMFASLWISGTRPASAPASEPVGAVSGPDHYEFHQFFSGLSSLSLKDTQTKSSSSSPASLGSGMSGHFVIAASATTGNASTTAVTATSDKVFLQQEDSTPIAGTTCNTSTIATGTKISLKVVTATSTNNGFVATVPAAPVTNPYCFSYFILK